MKVALYARVSKADDSQDPENQLLRLRQYVLARHWEVEGEYVDMASGADANRPQLLQMLRDAAGHRFSLVLTVRIDRIARSSLHLKQIIADLEYHGIKFECTDQAFSTATPTGRLLFGVLGEIAEFERALIIERTKAGLERAKAHGKILGRPRKVVDMTQLTDLRAQGIGYGSIARITGLSYSTVRDRLKNGGSGLRGDDALESGTKETDDSQREGDS